MGGAGERGALSAAWHGIASYLVLGAESAQRAAGAARAAPAGGRGRCRFRRRRFRRQRRWEERRSCIRRRFRGHVRARPRAARPLYLSICLSSVCVRAKRWADRGVHGAARAGYPGASSARAIVRAINERNSSRRIRRRISNRPPIRGGNVLKHHKRERPKGRSAIGAEEQEEGRAEEQEGRHGGSLGTARVSAAELHGSSTSALRSCARFAPRI